MPRPARPLDTAAADRLCAVAAEAFAARGLEGASLNGILSRARMGKGSFYHRFADKAALHDWVTERLSTALLREIRPPQPPTLTRQSFRDELVGLLARLGHVALTRPELMDLGRMFHNSADAPPERAITTVRRAVNDWIGGVLETGQALGTVRTDLPRPPDRVGDHHPHNHRPVGTQQQERHHHPQRNGNHRHRHLLEPDHQRRGNRLTATPGPLTPSRRTDAVHGRRSGRERAPRNASGAASGSLPSWELSS